jgi:CheY-like chemotaxis protein
MPGMDGYEVCRRMKDDKKLRSIPVIFLSALNEISDKIDAFKVGGVDYITKPFQFEEVNSRVVTHLKIHYLQDALVESNRQLEEKVATRTAQLAQANEHLKNLDRVKSDFLNMVCHEMRTPVNGLLNLADVAFELCPDSEKLNELKENFLQSRKRMEKLLDDSLFLGSLNSTSLQQQCNSEDILPLLEQICAENNCKFDVHKKLLTGSMVCGGELTRRALTTLIKLYCRFSKNSDVVSGEISQEQGFLIIKLFMDEVALSSQQAADFFLINSVVRASSKAEDMGLAPVVAERIISLLGGSVTIHSTGDEQGVMEVKIPMQS